MKKLDLKECFRKASKSFAHFWILLCLVTAIPCLYSIWLGGSDLIGQYSAAMEKLQPVMDRYEEDQDAIALQEGLFSVLNEIKSGNRKQKNASSRGHLLLLGLLVVTVFMQIVLILCTKRAVNPDDAKGRATVRRGLKRSLLLSFSYIIMALCKLVPFVVLLPFFLMASILAIITPWILMPIWLGYLAASLYPYMRWFFSDYIITEESANPIKALGESWRLTAPAQGGVSVLVLTAFALHLPALITLGLSTIPTRAFDFTLRATALRQLRDNEPWER